MWVFSFTILKNLGTTGRQKTRLPTHSSAHVQKPRKEISQLTSVLLNKRQVNQVRNVEMMQTLRSC